MSIGTVLIRSALGKIGAYSVAVPAEPEDDVLGMRILNNMLNDWFEDEIDLGVVPLSAPGDELSEPPGSRNAIENNLAVNLAPHFDNGKVVVSPRLLALAYIGYNQVKGRYSTPYVPNKILSATMPKGEGSARFYNRRVFMGKGQELKDA